MRVTLIRHGEAGDDARRDEERSLTKEGRKATRRVGRALARRKTRFSAVLTSPLVRAVQTAEIVAEAIGYRGRIAVTRALEPEAPAAGVVALLTALKGEKSVALVAHEPILSRVAAALLGVPRFRSLEKSEALRIRLPGGPAQPGEPRWRIEPDSGRRRRA